MNSFLKTNKKLISYSLIFLVIVPIFGLNFFINFIGNILILLILLPLLILIVALISFNSLKSKVKTCNECGAISIGFSSNCNNCGSVLEVNNINSNEIISDPSERTIEVKAEEIK